VTAGGSASSLTVAADDPLAADVRELLETHLRFSQDETPPQHVYALAAERLVDPNVTLFSARSVGVLLGVGALRRLDDAHAELKSMHVTAAARRHGVGRALVERLLAVAAERRYERVSLETGSMHAFAPARALYEGAGFRRCPPFGEYTANPFSVCMTIALPRATGSEELEASQPAS
jgi:putative acetyltransferase